MNTIATKPLCVSCGRHVNHDEKMYPIDFRGQRSRSQRTCGNKLVNTIETTLLHVSLSNFAHNINDNERMNTVDFGGQRSKVKVTMDIYEN